MICTLHQTCIQVVKSNRMSWAGNVASVLGEGEVNIGVWWGNVRKETTWKT